jgi:anion-transporting  ArsA/GET3 family ATPase
VVVLDAPASGHGIAWMSAPQLVSEVISSGPIGGMASEIASFLEDRQRFGSVVVTTAEEMPVHEALELLQAMQDRLQREPELVVVNSLYPEVERTSRKRDPATTVWRRRRQVNEVQLARLRERWAGPTAEVPLVAIDAGPALVGVVGERLAAEIEYG